ncbi:MAG: sulfatase-like hydrolase/transferase, partial [Candidatus Sumerlaeota bacterium]|nr:sulfatase-like hydrolase/transferase [Candidatus Sumerlaeota bacterium]
MIDACVGRILEALNRLGLEQDTLVLYTSDHGDLQAAHGMVGKIAPGFFEEVLRVPFILRYPAGIKPGAVSECATDGANVAPTLLDFAGAPIPEGVQGHSLRPAIETGTCATPDAAFCERGGAGRGAWGRMVRTKKAKYSIFSDGRRELFDLQNDPNEMRDLGAEPQAQALRDEMHALLMAHLERTQDAVADLIKGGVVTQPASRPAARPASRPAAKAPGGKTGKAPAKSAEGKTRPRDRAKSAAPRRGAEDEE